ncbi:MAG: hypothetical protein U1F00_07075 [Rhodoferax sp.]
MRAWQARLRQQGAAADPMEVVRAHVAAVRCRDADLMAADYTDAARIRRGAQVVVPRTYFPQALQRLGDTRLVVHALDRIADAADGSVRIAMQWELRGDRADGTRGTDTFTLQGDRIIDQVVDLHTADY